jgi:hypothetical protein
LLRQLKNTAFDQIIDVCIDELRSMGHRLDGRTARASASRGAF